MNYCLQRPSTTEPYTLYIDAETSCEEQMSLYVCGMSCYPTPNILMVKWQFILIHSIICICLKACSCSVYGAMSRQCNARNGQCQCKQQVEGLGCDQCKAGTFNLHSISPKGCQHCFGYGHTVGCTSADGFTASKISSDFFPNNEVTNCKYLENSLSKSHVWKSFEQGFWQAAAKNGELCGTIN